MQRPVARVQHDPIRVQKIWQACIGPLYAYHETLHAFHQPLHACSED